MVRIAQQAAVAVGAAQGFHHVVAALYRAGLLPGQLLQHQQALRQGHATGRRRRCADQLATVSQGYAQWLALHHPVVAQVAGAPDAATGFHALQQQACGFSAVEAGMAVAGQALQGANQRWLTQ